MSARETRRRQWGPTKADREIEALSQLADEGFNPKTRQEAAIAINERAKANTAARGEMAYDQALGQMVPSAKERARQRAEENERDVQKLGLSAEDYWERNPESKRTAVNSRGETVDVMDLNRAYMQDRDAEQLQAGRRAGVVANYRNTLDRAEADQLSSRLGEKGIEITDSLTKADGTLDPNKARGLLSASTFQQWDDDKMLDRAAKDLERRTKRELRYLEQAQDGEFGVGAQTQAMSSENQQRAAKLRAGIDAGDNDRNSLSGPGAWRRFAETELNNSAKQNAAVQNLIQATNARTMSYQDLAKTFGVTMESLEKYLKDGVLSPEEAAEIFAQQSN
jgi:hypothetical protein